MSDTENGNFKRNNNEEQIKEEKNSVDEEISEPTEPERLRKLFIGGLSYETTDENLKEYFLQWGTVVDVVVMREAKSRRSRGFGFITYSHSYMVDDAQNARPHKIDGRTVEPKRAVPRHDIDNPSAGATVTKLFVGGLRNDHSEEVLRDYFMGFGKVTRITLVSDKETGKFRGFAFVEFADYDPVDKIILQKNHTLLSAKINVKKAIPKEQMDRINESRTSSQSFNSNNCSWLARRSSNNYSWMSSGSRVWTSNNNSNNNDFNNSLPLNWNSDNINANGNFNYNNNDMNNANGTRDSNFWVGNLPANNFQQSYAGGPQRNATLSNNRNAPYFTNRLGNNYNSVNNYNRKN